MVDFLIPDEKIVIEGYGPHHFLKEFKNDKEDKNWIKKLNPNDEFKNEYLQLLGYKVMIIEGEITRTTKKTIELYVFEQYEKLREKNK